MEDAPAALPDLSSPRARPSRNRDCRPLPSIADRQTKRVQEEASGSPRTHVAVPHGGDSVLRPPLIASRVGSGAEATSHDARGCLWRSHMTTPRAGCRRSGSQTSRWTPPSRISASQPRLLRATTRTGTRHPHNATSSRRYATVRARGSGARQRNVWSYFMGLRLAKRSVSEVGAAPSGPVLNSSGIARWGTVRRPAASNDVDGDDAEAESGRGSACGPRGRRWLRVETRVERWRRSRR